MILFFYREKRFKRNFLQQNDEKKIDMPFENSTPYDDSSDDGNDKYKLELPSLEDYESIEALDEAYMAVEPPNHHKN